MTKDLDVPSNYSISYLELIKLLRELGCNITDINYLDYYLLKRNTYDISFSGDYITLLVPKTNTKDGYLIKIGDSYEALYDEYIASLFFHEKGIGPEVIDYISSGKDYLITKLPKGTKASDLYLSPIVMVRYMGQALRSYHDLGFNSKNIGHDARNVFISNKERFNDNILDNDEVLVHGNFNPANVYFENNKLVSVTNYSDTHLGDRYYDIFYAVKSICKQFNIYNDYVREEINQQFLNSYGIKDNKRVLKYY